jgi:hypothetical protein
MLPPLREGGREGRLTGAHRSPDSQSSLLMKQDRAGMLLGGRRGAGPRSAKQVTLKNRGLLTARG